MFCVRALLILLTILALAGLSAVNAQDDNFRDSLEYHRSMYSSYKHVEFDLGGEPSRFAWREMPGLFPHSTINHNLVRFEPECPTQRRLDRPLAKGNEGRHLFLQLPHPSTMCQRVVRVSS